MKSTTKVQLNGQAISALCASAGFQEIQNIKSLGAGEFNAVYAFDSGGKGYALKIAPDVRTPVMTYEKDMMRSEIFWYGQLRAHTDISIPEIVYTDFSRALLPSDFFIMERIHGRQMNEMEFLPTERAQAQALLPEIAVKMHRISHDGFGYPQCGFFDTWPKALYAMTEAMVKDAEAAGQACENGERTLAYIRKHAAVLNRAECHMVNFDLWEANILCERTPDGIRYVMIDPERGFWGDPVMDFNCFEIGKPLREKTASLHAYNRLAHRPLAADREEEIRFAFAQAYLGIVMEVERYYRYAPGDEGWTRNDWVCEMLFTGAFGCLETI